VLGLLAEDRFDEALRALDAASKAGPATEGEPDARLLEAVLLLGRGDVAQALSVCQRLLASDDLSAGAHYVMAQCREQLGETGAARDHIEMAAHLEPAFAMAHLQRGLMARRAGDLPTARQALARAAVLFPGEDSGRMLLFAAGFGRQALETLSRSELAACGEETP
jgi:chemotaxis protein methyltransferase CheR